MSKAVQQFIELARTAIIIKTWCDICLKDTCQIVVETSDGYEIYTCPQCNNQTYHKVK